MKTLDLASTVVNRKLNRPTYPQHLTLLVTGMCNSRCSMCNIWKSNGKDDLRLDEIYELSTSEYLKKVMYLGLSGGEPFLRRDLVDMVCSMDMPSLREVRFSTNGSLTKRIVKDIDGLLGFTGYDINVSVSIDGNEKTHDSIRGRRGFYRKAIETLHHLKALDDDRLSLCARFTMLPQNCGEMIDVYRMAKKLGIGFVSKPATAGGLYDNPKLIGWKQAYTPEQIEDTISTLEHISWLEEKDAKSLRDVVNAMFLKYSIDYIRHPEKMVFPCYACSSSAFIASNGDVRTCPVLYKKIGSIRKQPFDEIWSSRTTRYIREFIKSGQCSCYTQCSMTIPMVMSKWHELLRRLV